MKESKSLFSKISFWIIIVVVVWSCTLLLQLKFDIGSAGAFGDSFGITNSLFSGLAFALLIYNSWMQREELKLQREELKLTREANEKQVELFAKQIESNARLKDSEVLPSFQTVFKQNTNFDNHLGYTLEATVQDNSMTYKDCQIFCNLEENVIRDGKLPKPGIKRPGDVVNIRMNISIEQCRDSEFDFLLHFENIYGTPYAQAVHVKNGVSQSMDPVPANQPWFEKLISTENTKGNSR